MSDVIVADVGFVLRAWADRLDLQCHVSPGKFVEVYGNGRKLTSHRVGDVSKVGVITSITKKKIVIDGWLRLEHCGFAFRAI